MHKQIMFKIENINFGFLLYKLILKIYFFKFKFFPSKINDLLKYIFSGNYTQQSYNYCQTNHQGDIGISVLHVQMLTTTNRTFLGLLVFNFLLKLQ